MYKVEKLENAESLPENIDSVIVLLNRDKQDFKTDRLAGTVHMGEVPKDSSVQDIVLKLGQSFCHPLYWDPNEQTFNDHMEDLLGSPVTRLVPARLTDDFQLVLANLDRLSPMVKVWLDVPNSNLTVFLLYYEGGYMAWSDPYDRTSTDEDTDFMIIDVENQG